MVARKGCWQRAEEEKAVEEADGGDIMKEEDAAAYEDVLGD